MSLNADLREFIELLNSRGVEYVIVGAHSLAFHARPRYTGDLDILIKPSPENAAKLVSLLRDFGFGKSTEHPSVRRLNRELLRKEDFLAFFWKLRPGSP